MNYTDPSKAVAYDFVAHHREGDRVAILKAGGVPHLVALLRQGPYSEHTEYAAAVLGNLAAGGQALKDAIREARHFHTLHARQGAIVWQVLAGLEDANLRLFWVKCPACHGPITPSIRVH